METGLVLLLTASIVCFSDNYIVDDGYVVANDARCVEMNEENIKKQCIAVFDGEGNE